MGNYKAVRLDEIEALDDGRVPMQPVRHHLGIQAFGVNGFTAREAGDRLINEHDESAEYDRHEELYVVVTGHARFEIDNETVDAPQGTLVFVPPDLKRTAFAEEAGTTLLAVGAAAGQAYVPGGWEVWSQFNPLYRAGDYAGVADQGRDAIEASAYPMPMYNLACCEALAGRKEDAIGHLRTAIEGRPQLKELAREDSDLDAIRDEPAFAELVG
jgi:mannose-6-phosphate isomerase-like protein (cupin superfamily)